MSGLDAVSVRERMGVFAVPLWERRQRLQRFVEKRGGCDSCGLLGSGEVPESLSFHPTPDGRQGRDGSIQRRGEDSAEAQAERGFSQPFSYPRRLTLSCLSVNSLLLGASTSKVANPSPPQEPWCIYGWHEEIPQLETTTIPQAPAVKTRVWSTPQTTSG